MKLIFSLNVEHFLGLRIILEWRLESVDNQIRQEKAKVVKKPEDLIWGKKKEEEMD